MARKRNAHTRARDRRQRPQSPAPSDGFLIGDIARLTAIPVRTLRDYVQRGLLRYSQRRGTITRYPRGEVLRLLGALRLKAQTRETWAEIKRKLDAFAEPQLGAWLARQGLAPSVAAELGIAEFTRDAATSPEPPNTPPTEHGGACWQRTELLPGLELFLSAAASPLVKHAARLVISSLGK